jgi:1,4-alpha-glucan branching enzyme
MFWLADQEMYWHMGLEDENLVIDRAIALHKLIRLLTLGTAGNGYLNFMGNEFGHPEWVDFPRQGNEWSYHYARRQWSLRDNSNLKYKFLSEFDRAMMFLCEKYRVLEHEWPNKTYEHIEDMVLAFERAGLVLIFNLSPNRSYEGREIPCRSGKYEVVLNTDLPQFGGFGRVDSEMVYEAKRNSGMKIYLPSRTALVLVPTK